MQALETKRLNDGWWKELRVRGSGKQQGNIFVAYTHESGACYYSRTKAEAQGCVDPEPDKRTLRKGKKNPKPKAKTKPKAKAKRKVQDPESVDSDENINDNSACEQEEQTASDAD